MAVDVPSIARAAIDAGELEEAHVCIRLHHPQRNKRPPVLQIGDELFHRDLQHQGNLPVFLTELHQHCLLDRSAATAH